MKSKVFVTYNELSKHDKNVGSLGLFSAGSSSTGGPTGSFATWPMRRLALPARTSRKRAFSLTWAVTVRMHPQHFSPLFCSRSSPRPSTSFPTIPQNIKYNKTPTVHSHLLALELLRRPPGRGPRERPRRLEQPRARFLRLAQKPLRRLPLPEQHRGARHGRPDQVHLRARGGQGRDGHGHRPPRHL